jgi:hypothetical protein
MLQPQPFIVKVIEEPRKETTFGDVILGAFGITGVLVLIALVFGGLLAFLWIRWHRRHPPEHDHLPSITVVPGPDAPPSNPAR